MVSSHVRSGIVFLSMMAFVGGCSPQVWWNMADTRGSELNEAADGRIDGLDASARGLAPIDSDTGHSRVSSSTPLSSATGDDPQRSAGIQGPTITVSGVEIVWQVPTTPVEVYHLRYGYAPQELRDEVTVSVDQLEKFDHPAFGPVFRYRLRGVSAEKDLFVSLQAENRVGTSAPSDVISIPANRKSSP